MANANFYKDTTGNILNEICEWDKGLPVHRQGLGQGWPGWPRPHPPDAHAAPLGHNVNSSRMHAGYKGIVEHVCMYASRSPSP